MPRVGIILTDRLLGAGLLAVLERYFGPAEVECYADVDTSLREGGCFDCYFTDPGIFASHVDFFLPRRAQCGLLMPGAPNEGDAAEGTPRVIRTGDSLEGLLENVGRVLEAAGRSSEESASDELSAREVQVLQLVVSGAINKEIAERLSISLNTVLTHRKNITAKLGIKTISGLTLYALMHGYISAEDMAL